MALRASPMPVASGIVTYGFAASASVSGSNPMLIPPDAATPRHTAAMMPWRPPHTTVKPIAPNARPIASARPRFSSGASRGPITPTG